MKRRQFNVSEKLAILEEATNGDIVEVCRKNGISSATFYNWRKKFETKGEEGLKVTYNNSSPELKKAEEENRVLRKLLADKEIELEIQKELLKKKFGTDDPRKI